MICMFRCHLPPALLAEWPGSLMCHCCNAEAEQTLNKSQHAKLAREKKILLPLLPGLKLTTLQSQVWCFTNKLSWLMKHLATVMSAHWATVDWSLSKEWNYCVRAKLHLKKKMCRQGMNGWTFSPKSSQAKKKPPPWWCTGIMFGLCVSPARLCCAGQLHIPVHRQHWGLCPGVAQHLPGAAWLSAKA